MTGRNIVQAKKKKKRGWGRLKESSSCKNNLICLNALVICIVNPYSHIILVDSYQISVWLIYYNNVFNYLEGEKAKKRQKWLNCTKIIVH